jgi:hypothetical protein
MLIVLSVPHLLRKGGLFVKQDLNYSIDYLKERLSEEQLQLVYQYMHCLFVGKNVKVVDCNV